MNEDVKIRWAEALESGEYEKGTKRLRTPDNKFCCLGVLTDLCAKEKKISFEAASNGNLFALNRVVMDWAGLEAENPSVLVKDLIAAYPGIDKEHYGLDLGFAGDRKALSALNDEGVPFDKLAKVIRACF